MSENAHLPAAVADCHPATIPDRGSIEIMVMAEECRRWLKEFGEYRASLVTPPALAVWMALIQDEFDQVTNLNERLSSEIASRFSGDPV